MRSWRLLVLLGLAGSVGSASAATDSTAKPVGVYPLSLQGFSVSGGPQPKAHLWCQGVNLLGFVVPDEKSTECGTAAHKGSAPRALPLRDGRCEGDGSAVSFGFLESRKAWVFDAAGRKRVDRIVWLLYRFEGSLTAGRLKGALVQVDVNHPGSPFQSRNVDAQTLPDEQASFADEAAWRSGVAQAVCLVTGGP
jgi:hypothetical protein